MMVSSCDKLLGGRLRFYQPRQGYRAAQDGVLLSSCLPHMAMGRVLELGVGTGMAGLCFLWRLGAQVRRVSRVSYVGLEKQPRLAGYSRLNFRVNGFAPRARVIVGDMRFAHPSVQDGSFDLVFANPPWRVQSGKAMPQNNERATALMLGRLRLQDWVYGAARRVKRGGRLALIVDGTQENEVTRALALGFQCEHIWRLFSYHDDTCAKRVVLLARRSSSKEHKTHVSNVVLHDRHRGLSRVAEGVLRCGLSLEFAVQHFTDGGFGQGAAEHDMARHLVGRKMLMAETDERVC